MPLLKEIPREVKRGLGRERRRIQRKWVKKNWMWILLGCVVAIVVLVFLVLYLERVLDSNTNSACYVKRLFPSLVTDISIDSGKCSNDGITILDLSQYKNLKSVVVGDESFMYASLVLKGIQ